MYPSHVGFAPCWAMSSVICIAPPENLPSLRTGLHCGVGHDLLPAAIARFLVRPENEREYDILIVRGLHGSEEVGGMAVLEIVADRLDRAERALRLRLGREGLGELAILVF